MSGFEFVFAEAQMAHLRAMKAQGKNLVQSAAEFGVDCRTMTRAIMEAGYKSQVRALYINFARRYEEQQRAVVEITAGPVTVPDNIQAKWLAKAWRKAT